MRINDFGGFSTRTCSIDLKFSSPEQFDHFLETWGSGGRPKLETFPQDRWMEMISVGTTLEHELRHYHDFLLSYSSLHNYWLRMQAMINAGPLITRMLHDPYLEYLVFPAIEWAKTSLTERRTYIVDALGTEDALARTWSPPVLEGPKPGSSLPDGLLPADEETYRYMLFVIRDQLELLKYVRGGIDDPRFPFPFAPRFASELSALLVQCASVQQTYGFDELGLFMNSLAADGSLYARFFRAMVALFSRNSRKIADGTVTLIDTMQVDWRALGVSVAWCFCGSAERPELLKPVDRLGRIIEAAEKDFSAAFPGKLGFNALLDHLDRYFRVEPARAAACRNSDALRGFLDRNARKLTSAGEVGRRAKPLFDVFEALINERDRVVARIFEDPEGYTDVGRYVRELPQWPQCPVSLDFTAGRMGVTKSTLRLIGRGAVFVDAVDENGHVLKDVAAEVSYQSFLPGGSSFPWRKARSLADERDLFDMFFDPQQIGVERERQFRRLISKVNGKTLLRFFP